MSFAEYPKDCRSAENIGDSGGYLYFSTLRPRHKACMSKENGNEQRMHTLLISQHSRFTRAYSQVGTAVALSFPSVKILVALSGSTIKNTHNVSFAHIKALALLLFILRSSQNSLRPRPRTRFNWVLVALLVLKKWHFFSKFRYFLSCILCYFFRRPENAELN